MSVPVLDAAGIAGFTSLSLTLFHGCIQAFELLETAHHLGRDADVVRCMLEWEQYRLYQWSERVGLEGAADQPNPRLNWNLVVEFLRQLESLLTSTTKLRERYHLQLEELDESSDQERQPPASERPSRQTGVRRILARLKPNFYLASSRIIQAHNGPMKRLRWAVWDKDKVHQLIQDITYFNDCLHSLLETAEQDLVRSALGALLRDIVSRSTASSELEVIMQLLDSPYISSPGAIAAAASIKQLRLIVGLDKRPDENISVAPLSTNSSSSASLRGGKPKLSKLKFSQLVRASPSDARSGKEIAIYKSRQVWIEWKSVEKRLERQLRLRIEGLALLLSNAVDPSFHSLHCLGFLDDESGHYAFVFEIPTVEVKKALQPTVTIRSLAQLFTHPRLPSLNERLHIALALAETVLQLHTAGWLHKGIRSDNVLLLDIGERNWDCSTSIGPYLAGYEYARGDSALERTETTPSSPEMDIYRHPNMQVPARPTFKKYFDLFALGCVFLEVGLWSTMQDILTTYRIIDGESDGKLQAEMDQLLERRESHPALVQLAFSAGHALQEAITLCFTAGTRELGDDEDAQSSIDTQKSIVNNLKACRC